MNDKTKLSYMEGYMSIALNSILFGLKLWVGILSASVAVMADAWHTLADSFTSIVVIIGAKTSRKPPDREHPFGHGRAELIASIIIGTLLGVVGINFIIEAITKLIHHDEAVFKTTAAIVFLISVITKEAIAQFSFWAARKTGSQPLKADAWHHRSDAIASLIILAGLFLGRYFWWIDGVLGILVAALIVYTAWDIIREGINPLLGEGTDKLLVEKINKIAESIKTENFFLHHFHIHKYGDHTELTFHMQFAADYSLDASHQIASRLETEIKNQLNMETTIHIEPQKGTKSRE